MKYLYIIFIFSLLLVGGTKTAFAQDNQQQSASTIRLAEEQRRLKLADSLHRVHSSRANETERALKEAERELKVAQARYKQAKEAHMATTKAQKEARQSYKMEQKAIKAREKADKQATKAGNQ